MSGPYRVYLTPNGYWVVGPEANVAGYTGSLREANYRAKIMNTAYEQGARDRDELLAACRRGLSVITHQEPGGAIAGEIVLRRAIAKATEEPGAQGVLAMHELLAVLAELHKKAEGASINYGFGEGNGNLYYYDEGLRERVEAAIAKAKGGSNDV